MEYMSLLRLSAVFLFRHRARTILALGAMSIAFALFGTLDAVRLVFESQNTGDVPRLVVTSRRSLNEGLARSTSLLFTPLGVPVGQVAWANWVGGYYQNPETPISNIAVSADYLRLYPELHVSTDTLKRFAATKNGVVVGKQLALDRHWAVGQNVHLLGVPFQAKDAADTGWTYQVVGTFEVADQKLKLLESQFLSRWDYLDDMAVYGHGMVGWFVVNAGKFERQDLLAAAIDKATENSSNPTRAQTEQAFQRQMANQVANVGWVTRGLIGATVTFVLLLTGKVMAQTIRESIQELGVMKAIGFTTRFLLLMLVVQSALLVVFSAILGLATATAGVAVLHELFPAALILQPISLQAWLDGLGVATIAGILVSLRPSVRTSRGLPAQLLRG
ncbi:putative ABC transport system permease protein [Luteibacter sp. Sphag1AF]|uniref:ABC transporter permease n=1 Tax=Luteibacter sp. Sphag1AF TaxID=2587031 RepID=UPI00161EF904|nr:ABC transporter permease [Luteibacter sp. Sphag1AF]MBB3228707.1 putative ABC transport system permease protein [Luteibacter sp. Sphag1AF]